MNRGKLQSKFLNGEINEVEIKKIENEFVEAIKEIGFEFDQDIVLYEEHESIFRYIKDGSFYIRLQKSASIYEDEYTPPLTSWGEWHIIDDISNLPVSSIAYYISPAEKTNVTSPEGDATACYGFWMEGVDQIPEFIKKYKQFK
ncbi:hypothetical protein [Paenibacillus sp. V4I7]|uniref:hypothetical protein n=1 Tax=Paenibacillus sp. V4I7 TaxID=3042307 RepID=UPI00278A4D6E|nr:hypothetical protein [Paenibacillus sp. V4I7]MDQ0897412.1 hypothetical protein [Paenibacillus sp. V4I7]